MYINRTLYNKEEAGATTAHHAGMHFRGVMVKRSHTKYYTLKYPLIRSLKIDQVKNFARNQAVLALGV
jgi:hypothetical protein